jgi:hypothetical protein
MDKGLALSILLLGFFYHLTLLFFLSFLIEDFDALNYVDQEQETY